jgi:hypothetical protein
MDIERRVTGLPDRHWLHPPRAGETSSARAQHDLPSDSDPGALARFVAAVVYGMAVLASGGASRTELEQVICTAMKAFPATVRDCAYD